MSHTIEHNISCSNCAYSIRYTKTGGCQKNKEGECLRGNLRIEKVTDGSIWYVNRVSLSYTKFVPHTLLVMVEEDDMFSDEDFLL